MYRLALLLLFPPLACCSIEGLLSAPFASALTASPTGARVAWIEYQQGRRNVWVAAAPDWTGAPVTHFGEDDGQEISGLTWSPQGDALVFVRGGDDENGGENPNPGQLAALPSQDIWRVELKPASAAKLTEGHSPAFCGGGLAFLRGKEIFSIKGIGAAASPIVHDKGEDGELTCSPKGDTLAFVSRRAGHSFIALYSYRAGTVHYLDPSSDQDVFPSWSPDGTVIAYVRLPVGGEETLGPRREGEPWSIRVARATDTGWTFHTPYTNIHSPSKADGPHEVFHATAGKGSVFHALGSDRQILWKDASHIVFPWEKTGWLHLYSIALTPGEATDLTPGEGEVEFASATAAGGIFYSGNIGDIDARHVWQIGGPAQPLTTAAGVQTNPVGFSGESAVAFLLSTYNRPLHAVVRLASGAVKNLDTNALPADFTAQQITEPQTVLLSAADGLMLHGQLFLPPADGKKHAALVFFHGGSRRQMLPAFHYRPYYSNAYAMNQYLASQGYVVLSVNYRSGIGYGLDFREAANYGYSGASEYNDVMGAGLYLRGRADVDAKRIGAWGGSYGGYLTALALARSSDLFAAGVDFHGVHDWSSLRAFRQPDKARLALESSPLADVSGWRSPVLLIHGDDDRNVDFRQTEQLVEALRRQKVEFEEMVFPNEIHDFLLHRSWVAAYQATADFFARKLMNQ